MKITINELKSESREKLLRRYGTVMGAFLIIRIITMFSISVCQSLTGAYGIIYLGMIAVLSLLEGVLIYGDRSIYLDIASGRNTSVKNVFSVFRTEADRAIGLRFLQMILLVICVLLVQAAGLLVNANNPQAIVVFYAWSAVVMVGMIYVLLAFSQTTFIMLDNKEIKLLDALKQSANLMEGKKIKLLMVYISFIPMAILTVISMMLGSLYFHPYLNQTLAEFYLEARIGE